MYKVLASKFVFLPALLADSEGSTFRNNGVKSNNYTEVDIKFDLVKFDFDASTGDKVDFDKMNI